MTPDRVDAAYAAITARARAAAGEVPDEPAARVQVAAPLPHLLATLLTAPAGAPPCDEEGCPDLAYVYVLTGSGTPSEDGTPLCGRHARRVWLDTPAVIAAIPPKEST